MPPVDPTADIFQDPDVRVLQHLAALALTESRALAAAALDAVDVQWIAAPVPRPRDDTTERAKGGHGDPTSAIAVDDRRLAVRAAVTGAQRDLAFAIDRLRAARDAAEGALAAWSGQ